MPRRHHKFIHRRHDIHLRSTFPHHPPIPPTQYCVRNNRVHVDVYPLVVRMRSIKNLINRSSDVFIADRARIRFHHAIVPRRSRRADLARAKTRSDRLQPRPRRGGHRDSGPISVIDCCSIPLPPHLKSGQWGKGVTRRVRGRIAI